MAGTKKKFVEIDIVSDIVCPWCFIAKRNLDKALVEGNDQYEFELRWHPYQVDPDVPIEGTSKYEYYKKRMGADESGVFELRILKCFEDHGLEYKFYGLVANTLQCHRLIYFAGQQDHDKQHDLMDEICLGYFTEAKNIGDMDYLLECATKIEVEGAAEFLGNPNNGINEVKEEIKKYSGVKGIPYFIINGTQEFAGAQPPEVFLAAFEAATK